MDSVTPYHLSKHEDGTWHVIDRSTGGPAEVIIRQRVYVLYRLPEEEARQWSILLNQRVREEGQ